jgi:hypothetical protein
VAAEDVPALHLNFSYLRSLFYEPAAGSKNSRVVTSKEWIQGILTTVGRKDLKSIPLSLCLAADNQENHAESIA